MDMKSTRMELKSILKDIEYMGPSHMTWKKKKALENKKVVSLGGKPPKKQRLPLTVARVQMKTQKEREQKMLQEMSTVGNFRNGVLDVKDLLKFNSDGPETRGFVFGGDFGNHGFVGGSTGRGSGHGGKKKGGKKNHGKKGGRRKGH